MRWHHPKIKLKQNKNLKKQNRTRKLNFWTYLKKGTRTVVICSPRGDRNEEGGGKRDLISSAHKRMVGGDSSEFFRGWDPNVVPRLSDSYSSNLLVFTQIPLLLTYIYVSFIMKVIHVSCRKYREYRRIKGKTKTTTNVRVLLYKDNQ